MALTDEQKEAIASTMGHHLNQIKNPEDDGQKLAALNLTLEYEKNLSITAAAALATWHTKKEKDLEPLPLLPSVLYLRSLQKDPSQIKGITTKEDIANARKYIQTHINARISNLKHKNKALEPAAIPTLTLESTKAFISTAMLASIYDLTLSFEMAKVVASSDNKTIRYAIDYGLKGAMTGLLSSGSLLGPETAIGIIAGGIGGTIVSAMPQEQQAKTSMVVDAVINGITSQAKASLNQAAYTTTLAAVTSAAAAYTGTSSNTAGILAAGAIGFSTKHDVYNAFASAIGKTFYYYTYDNTGAGTSLKQRNIEGFVFSRIAAGKMSDLAKSNCVFSSIVIAGVATQSMANYITQEKNNPNVTKDEKKVLDQCNLSNNKRSFISRLLPSFLQTSSYGHNI